MIVEVCFSQGHISGFSMSTIIVIKKNDTLCIHFMKKESSVTLDSLIEQAVCASKPPLVLTLWFCQKLFFLHCMSVSVFSVCHIYVHLPCCLTEFSICLMCGNEEHYT